MTAGDVRLVQEVGGGYGHFGMQSDLVLHFGIGECEQASVEIRWPDGNGTTDTFDDVVANVLTVFGD